MNYRGRCKTCHLWLEHWRCACSKFVDVSDNNAETPRDGVGYWVSSACPQEAGEANIQTGPGFGCIHWAKREEAP
jgi:hypothetical protein